jgi:carbon monoxide dehydrogenase subunit G
MVNVMKPLTEINIHAPVIGEREIEIAASPEVAWEVLTAIGRWPSWNPAVKSVAIDGPIGEGSTFRWKAGPGTIRSTIEDMDKPVRIAWTGTSLGLKATHVHTLEGRDGKTLVRTMESYEGLVARLFKRRLQTTLDNTLQGELDHLKAEAERQDQT